MHKVWAVIRREFLERVRTKWFIISTVLGPIFMIGITVLPAVLAARGGAPRSVAVVDESGGMLGQRLLTQLGTGNKFNATLVRVDTGGAAAARDSLTRQVQQKLLDGFLVVTSATVESGIAEYRGRNVSSLRDMALIEGVLRQVVVMERLTRSGIDPAVVQEAQTRIDLRTLRITRRGATGETGEATFALAYIIGIVIYMAIFLYSVNVMRSVIDEKQTRIVEVLVSSLRPFQLMLGKVIGVGGVGLFQFSIWGVAAALLFRYRQTVFGMLGVPPEQASQVQLPPIGGALVLIIIAYFLLGYVIYSALFAVVGASVNTEAEAQQAQMPVTMLLVAAIIVFPVVLQEPSGQLAAAMGLIPFFSPIIMPIRYAVSEVPTEEVLLSLAVLAVSTVAIVWVAGRIYRVGILMYGKRPTVRELLRWVREG